MSTRRRPITLPFTPPKRGWFLGNALVANACATGRGFAVLLTVADLVLAMLGGQNTGVVSATSARVTGRDLWRRYRTALIAAIPAGALLGAVADLAFLASTVHAAPQDRIPALLAYASLGATFALVACVGAVLALLIGRPRAASVAAQCWYIAAGAGAAVCVGVLIAGALSAAITDSWEWYSLYAVVAIGTGAIAAVGAGGITAFFQYRHRLLP